MENDFYIGTLTQGKTTTPNYKLKQRKTKDQSEWSVVENNHEPLVDKKAFEIAQRILAQDTYTGKDGKLPLFSGMLFCADCGEAMTRTSVKANGKIYFYYMCSSYRCDKSCTSHRISQSKLEDLVLTILKELIYELVNAKEVLEACKGTRSVSYTERRLQKELLRKENELKNASNMISEVYADFKTGLISEDDFIVIKSNFEEKRLAAKNKIYKIKEDLDNLKVLDHTQSEIVKQFEEYKNITALTRKVLLYTIRKIVVCEDNAIEIEFDCQDQLKVLLENAEEMRKAQVV